MRKNKKKYPTIRTSIKSITHSAENRQVSKKGGTYVRLSAKS
jgi:hypothetical protein